VKHLWVHFEARNAEPCIAQETAQDVWARENLLDRSFGAEERRRKTCERLRENRLPAQGQAGREDADHALAELAQAVSLAVPRGQQAAVLGQQFFDDDFGLLDPFKQRMRRTADLGGD